MTSLRPPTLLEPRSVPVSLDDLATRTAALWSIEPPVLGQRRTELLVALSELDADIDAIRIRSAAGIDIHPRVVRSCAQRYLRLRDQWSDREMVA